MHKPRIAWVVQRYGLEVAGGAELLCRLLAESTRKSFDHEILTTCARDHETWADHYEPGVSRVNGIPVRRFRVDFERDPAAFRDLSNSVLGGPHSQADEESWMRAQGPFSSRLTSYVVRHEGAYDVFVFVTYLYASTYYALPQVARKAALMPTAHDERPIYLSLFDRIFRLPRHLLCCSREELLFIEKRFGAPSSKMTVVGGGIETAVGGGRDPDWESVRGQLPPGSACVVYVGRVEVSKGCLEMLDYCRRFRADFPQYDLQLLLLGRGDLESPPEPHVHRTGFVSTAFKQAAIRHCQCLLMPSAFESLSLAALEAWNEGKPVLVNGDCAVLKGHCRRGNCGLWHHSYEEFREALRWVLENRGAAQALGRQGRGYVRKHHGWSEVTSRFREAIEPLVEARH